MPSGGVQSNSPAAQCNFSVRACCGNKQPEHRGLIYYKACFFTVTEHLRAKVRELPAPRTTVINNFASVCNVTFTQRLQVFIKGEMIFRRGDPLLQKNLKQEHQLKSKNSSQKATVKSWESNALR